MNRQVPTLGKLLTMVVFALSVFGLTLFLWLTFGGAVPFKAEGYRIKTSFPEATQLATEADVRIAGVPVGRVKKVTPGDDGRAAVVLEVQDRFAPLPKGTEAILRQKTLLGETYVSLTPPNNTLEGTPIPEGGSIPEGDVGETVELDELFQTFDADTRRYFQQWMQEAGKGFDGQGESAGRALVQLQLWIASLAETTKTLDEQSPALRSALQDGRTVLNAATEQEGALREAFVQGERVFRQLGEQDAALTELVERLPVFLARTRSGTLAVERFARDTQDEARNLLPTAEALTPAFESLRRVSPELRQLLEGVERTNRNAIKGLPATRTALASLPTLLDPLDPFLRQVNPILEYAGRYGNELNGSLGNLAAATQAHGVVIEAAGTYRDGGPMRAARGATILQPESLTTPGSRLETNRANAYRKPGWGLDLVRTLEAQVCGTTEYRIPDSGNALLNELGTARASGSGRDPLGPNVSALDAIRYSLFDQNGYWPNEPNADYAAQTPSVTPAPQEPAAAYACNPAGAFNIGGRLSIYPQLPEAPTSTAPSVNTGG